MTEGEPIELEAHMARLGPSTRELFGTEAPPDARKLVHKWSDRRLLERAERECGAAVPPRA